MKTFCFYILLIIILRKSFYQSAFLSVIFVEAKENPESEKLLQNKTIQHYSLHVDYSAPSDELKHFKWQNTCFHLRGVDGGEAGWTLRDAGAVMDDVLVAVGALAALFLSLAFVV